MAVDLGTRMSWVMCKKDDVLDHIGILWSLRLMNDIKSDHVFVHKSVPEDKLDIRRTLEEEARKARWLILWLDCDREGENIAFEVVEVCTQANHNLDIWRARFSALIEREIHHSMQNLV